MPEAPTVSINGLGHSVRRKEDPRFLRGKGNYIDDLKLPGMLYMDIVRSPYAHAKLVSIDASEALKVPGVAAVVTGKDPTRRKKWRSWWPPVAMRPRMALPR